MRLIARGPISSAYEISVRDFKIGSAPDNNLVLSDPSVSRYHAIICHRFWRYSINDLKSTNGTFVNGARVTRPTQLRHGNDIRFAAITVRIRRSRFFHLKSVVVLTLSCSLIAFIATTVMILQTPSRKTFRRLSGTEVSPIADATPDRLSGVLGEASAAPTATKPTVGPVAISATSEFTNHDISAMAYLLCTVRVDSENYLALPGFHDSTSEAEAFYNAALRMRGPEAKALDERLIHSGQGPEGYFSFNLKPSEDEDTERQRFVDWLARLKHLVETHYSSYTLVVGSSFIEPRDVYFLGTAVPRSRIYPGAKYNYKGRWSKEIKYLPGDLVVQPPLMLVASKVNTNVVLGSDVSGLLGGGRGQDVIGSWQLFPQDLLCSALNTALAAKLGDPTPLGGYPGALNAVQEEEKRANEIKKLN
jgi:hypothetical protein